MKEGGLPESLEAAIEAINSAVREVPDMPEADQLKAVADALEGALEEVEKGKVANLLPVLEQAQSIVESAPLFGVLIERPALIGTAATEHSGL